MVNRNHFFITYIHHADASTKNGCKGTTFSDIDKGIAKTFPDMEQPSTEKLPHER